MRYGPRWAIAGAVCAAALLMALATPPAFATQSEQPPLLAGSAATASSIDPYLDEQWALGAIDAFGAWDQMHSDGKVTVAVIDNGFLVNHEDLKDNIVATYNAVTDSCDPADATPFQEGESTWHGTHVCGIISACANNGKGIAGVSYNANLLPIKAFTSSTEASSDAIAKAYDFVIAHADEYNIKVVNFSGGHRIDGHDADEDRVIAKIQEAYDKGILTVCAAGNSAEAGPYSSFPGDLSDCALNVIALKREAPDGSDPVYMRMEDSNYNLPGQTTKDICAPGADIWSTDYLPRSDNTSSYREASGTSMAAPCVAGVAALVYAANPKATAADVADILCRTATDLGDSGWDAEYGFGMVNASAAVKAALDVTSVARADITLSCSDYTYDGTAKRPEATVVLDGEELKAETDFTVVYANNTNAGTATAIIKGAGAYNGIARQEFTISRAIAEIPKPLANLVYNGNEQCGVEADVGFTVSGGMGTSAGERTATARLKSRNYEWSDGSTADRLIPWSIAPAQIGDSEITGIPAWRYRSGQDIRPAIQVECNALPLEQGKDYAITYKDNRAVGTAHVTIKGTGNYTGTLQQTFRIIDEPKCSGATKMPVSSSAIWKLENCTVRVIGGAANCVSISANKLYALQPGTVTIGVFNDAGVCVSKKNVKVHRVAGSLRQIKLAANERYRIAFDVTTKAQRTSARLHKGALKKALRCRFVPNADGTYRILNAKRTYALTAKSGTSGKARVYFAKARNGKAQRWRIAVDSSDRLVLINEKTGMTLCRTGAKLSAKAKIVQAKSPSTALSTWRI